MFSELPEIYQQVPEISNLSVKQLKIFKAALVLFAQRGYTTTSTLQIAQEAGVSEGTLFKKFGNKKQLLQTIITPLTLTILPEDPQKLLEKNQLSRHNFVLSFINDRINFLKRNILPIQILTREILYDQLKAAAFLAQVPVPQVQALNQVFQKLKHQGQIVNWPNREILKFLFNGLFEYVVLHYILLKDQDWDELSELKRIITFTTKGLAPENP